MYAVSFITLLTFHRLLWYPLPLLIRNDIHVKESPQCFQGQLSLRQGEWEEEEREEGKEGKEGRRGEEEEKKKEEEREEGYEGRRGEEEKRKTR